MEFNLIAQLHCGLRDLDETDIESLYGLSGYLLRKAQAEPSVSGKPGHEKSQRDILTIGKRKYRRVSADKATWL